MTFNKILLAKNSPKNKCFAEDGEILIVAQKEHKMKGNLPKDHHFFIGVKSGMPSRYGWVSEIDYSIDELELAKKHTENPTESLVESCKELLCAISKHQEGTPMACTMSVVGILEKKQLLRIHKVLFHKKK